MNQLPPKARESIPNSNFMKVFASQSTNSGQKSSQWMGQNRLMSFSYDCKKGVHRVLGLTKEQLSNPKKLGVYPCSVSVLLTEKHLEFAVVLDTEGQSLGIEVDSKWSGFYFCGKLKNLEKCFQKNYHNLRAICTLVQTNLKHPDPYSSPLLIIGEQNEASSQVFWQVSEEDKAVGFIPLLHKSDTFHSLAAFPIISFEAERLSENEILPPTSIRISSDVDRNDLIPLYPELETLYTQYLNKLFALFKQQKWSCFVHSVSPSIPLSSKEYIKDLAKQLVKKHPHSTPLTIASGISFCKKNTIKDIDLLSIRLSPSGRAYFVNIVEVLSLRDAVLSTDSEGVHHYDLHKCKEKLERLVNASKDLSFICAKGVSIYNPFLKKERANLKQVIFESHPSKTQQSISSPFSSPPRTYYSSHSPSADTPSTSPLPHHQQLLPTASTSTTSTSSDERYASPTGFSDPSILKTGSPLRMSSGSVPHTPVSTPSQPPPSAVPLMNPQPVQLPFPVIFNVPVRQMDSPVVMPHHPTPVPPSTSNIQFEALATAVAKVLSSNPSFLRS